MSVLEYASKFMELSRFAPAFVADERLKMNWFEVGLNPTIKERMSIRQYTSYIDLYDTTVNVERVMKEQSNYFDEQRGAKRKGDNWDNWGTFSHNSRTVDLLGASTLATSIEVASIPIDDAR